MAPAIKNLDGGNSCGLCRAARPALPATLLLAYRVGAPLRGPSTRLHCLCGREASPISPIPAAAPVCQILSWRAGAMEWVASRAFGDKAGGAVTPRRPLRSPSQPGCRHLATYCARSLPTNIGARERTRGIRTNCGPHALPPAMRASMGWRRGTAVASGWPGTRCATSLMSKIFKGQEINHHKMDHCLERRDPEFKQNIAEVLYIYREVKIIKETTATVKPSDAVAIIPSRSQAFRRPPNAPTVEVERL
jgi:hypothetical protein